MPRRSGSSHARWRWITSVLSSCLAISVWLCQPASAVADSPAQMCFDVDDTDGRLVKDADLSLIARDGSIIRLGATDELGRVCFEAALLQPGAVAFLFCHAQYSCGALLAGPGYGFGDHIALAPFHIH